MANDTPSYKKIWQWFSEEEKIHICTIYVEYTKTEKASDGLNNWLIKELAKKLAFRAQTLKKFSDRKLGEQLRKFALVMLDDNDWAASYYCYYMVHQNELMCAFLDELTIQHDEYGNVTEELHEIDEISVIKAENALLKNWPAKEVLRYFSVLLHMHECWQPLKSRITALSVKRPESNEKDTNILVDEATSNATTDVNDGCISEEFTTLDKVIIDHIVATTTNTEGALNPGQLDDLIDTISSLNAAWHRAYFHLGFKDTLLPDSIPDFNKPELNDIRREWYLAGVLTAHARRRDSEGIREMLRQHGNIFNRAAKTQGGPGATIARNLLSIFIEIGLISEAASLLDGQFEILKERIATITLEHASTLIRANEIASADVLLRILCEKLTNLDDDQIEFDEIKRSVKRKFGQCQQAKGDFLDATKMFEELLENEDGETAELLADLGLVKCGFRSLAEIRIPEDSERRVSMAKNLEKGESQFKKAAEKYGVKAPNANYALSVLYFINYQDDNGSARNDKQRNTTLSYIQDSITGILSSPSKNAYQSMGVIGRARFMQAVIQITRLESSDVNTVMAAWNEITEECGKLPLQDIEKLLENLQLVEEKSAIVIAESIWSYRQSDALHVISKASWISGSKYIRDEILKVAQDKNNSRNIRWKLLTVLVPSLIQNKNIVEAENCLDLLEELSLEPDIAEKFLGWLEVDTNYDPVWTNEDVQRQMFRLHRLLGNDEKAYSILNNLFYSVRDKSVIEAEQIIALFKDLNAPESYYEDLVLPEHDETDGLQHEDAEQRLKQGEAVSVLFVGGNEVQEKYDDWVVRHLGNKWPGVTVTFEHTGWSSNWGRELDRILRLARVADSVVIMSMMRTNLGRRLREGLNNPGVPWIPCTGAGRTAVQRSIEKAVYVASKLCV